MFTGIVEAMGVIDELENKKDCMRLMISPYKKLDDLTVGDSISVNGACLTVTKHLENKFEVVAVPETLRVTNINKLSVNSLVNLERSMQLNDRVGGHCVQGHVDEVGKILSLKKEGEDALIAKISISSILAKYIVNKSYIALDGMSMTIIEAASAWFTVTFIPYTRQTTIVHQYQEGTWINIEVDILSKYAEKFLTKDFQEPLYHAVNH